VTSLPPPLAVLSRYPFAHLRLQWHRVAGGFSGAEVWCADDETHSPVFALKAWPPEFPIARLAQIHAWMSRAAHLSFVPAILRTVDGDSIVTAHDRIWDASSWMPGTPRESPSAAEVEAACAALALLHAAWPAVASRPCPGVLNRLRVLHEWLSASVDPAQTLLFAPSLNLLLRRASNLATSTAPAAIRLLEPWATTPLRIQPCLRDVRGEHVLFSGSAVTGIVDYGATAEDHPSVDLARLLGDFAAENEALFASGLRTYREAGGELDIPDTFVRILDRAGALCSIIMWVVRLCLNRQSYPDTTAVETRLDKLLRQVGQFGPI